MALLPEDPKGRNAVLLAVVGLAGLYFFHSYWVTPRSEDNEARQARLEQLEAQNRRAQVIATRGGAELEQRLALYEGHIRELEQLIPQDEEVAQLLEDMSFEARQAGVEVTLMRPEPLESGVHYDKWSYEIGVEGEYHAVGRFLAAIASLSRIIAAVDMELGPVRVPPENPSDETPIAARFRIQTYVVPDPGAAAPDARVASNEENGE